MKLLIVAGIVLVLCLLIPLLSGNSKKVAKEFRDELALKLFKSIGRLVLFIGLPALIIIFITFRIESSPAPLPPYDKAKARACLETGGGWILTDDGNEFWCRSNIDYYQNENGEIVYKDASLNN